MNVTAIRKTLRALDAAAAILGPEATLKQLSALLVIAEAGPQGIDGGSLQHRLDASQAATSRTSKLLGPGLGLVEFFLDQNDGRRRLSRVTDAGRGLVESIVKQMQ